ncbi:DUF3291 domain-containing protein [Muriicola soli]|uniref:DUF3291 domain-containing protein n=1 Tax=Muriicola soli TaxID=2507538 RepID=A0A411E800_9FLAO|nr:DUF3291 domain-containing protein [Muriicola soli]QBA63778.1 DUF3291 domain-containing protein [Muriicola soli]
MNYYFAQVNIAKSKYPLEDTRMADFVNNTARINAIAEKSPGFVWRWVEEPNSGVSEIFGDPALVVNMSIWESRETLMEFTYQSPHVEIYKRKNEWFDKLNSAHMVCFFTQKREISLSEAKKRLDHLNTMGETPIAFTFKSSFSPGDVEPFLANKTDGL